MAGELLGHALEHLLDGGGVTDEGGGHLEALGRDVADGRLDVVRDPLDEVGGVLVRWTLSICSSTSLVDMRPRNMQHAVR